MPELPALGLERGDDMRMRVAEAGHADAAAEIQIALAVGRVEVRPLAPLEGKPDALRLVLLGLWGRRPSRSRSWRRPWHSWPSMRWTRQRLLATSFGKRALSVRHRAPQVNAASGRSAGLAARVPLALLLIWYMDRTYPVLPTPGDQPACPCPEDGTPSGAASRARGMLHGRSRGSGRRRACTVSREGRSWNMGG